MQLQELKDSAFKTSLELLSNTFAQLGYTIGEVAAGTKTAKDAFAVFLKSIGDLLLVQVPKLLGLFLLQAAVSSGFPAGIPFALAGLGLVAFSGVAAGLLAGGGAQNDVGAQAQNNALASATSGAAQSAQGLVGNDAKENGITNITVVLDANGIVKEIQRQQILNDALNG
jgi:hypothetical protein